MLCLQRQGMGQTHASDYTSSLSYSFECAKKGRALIVCLIFLIKACLQRRY